MPNIKLVIEYDGSRYHGWQRQPGLPTVQGALEAAVATIAQQRPTVIGAGRTDAGVHAQGQVANFKINARLTSAAWMRALNSLLPEDIVIVSAQKVSSRFHSRFSAVGKIYRYRILNRRYPPAIGRQYVWTVYSALDIRRMKSAAQVLLGKHDFSSFKGANPSEDRTKGKKRSAVCHLRRLDLVKRYDDLVITIEADRFLQQMVRTIVGTLVEVGRGRRGPREMSILLQKKDRRFSGPTAPAQGLCLVEVKY
ncbi:MAG: tRNA pseudouridine(38-40) synthase TruA [Nitrospirae bacterium]|nr:tRNA pseudouridine(38-40) synthase TruA [Nitrospirota bacterium]